MTAEEQAEQEQQRLEKYVEGLVKWTNGKRCFPGGRPRILHKAIPDENFWLEWKADKDRLRYIGVSPKKDPETGRWEIYWWRQPPPEERQVMRRNAELSRKAAADVEIVKPDNGMDYYPFQKVAIMFARGKSGVLFADEMGLGKTLQSIGVINEHPEVKRSLVVCPASVKVHWYREMSRWLVKPYRVNLATPQVFPADDDIVIINWDILARHQPAIEAVPWDVVIADEVHYAKSIRAKRTKVLLGLGSPIKLALSGTPILNTVEEIWPILHWINPDEFPSIYNFRKKYCSAYGRASNEEAERLQARLRETCMIRRLKADVLPELPPKQRQVVEIAPPDIVIEREREVADQLSGSEERLVRLEAALELAKVSDDPAEYAQALENLRAGCRISFEHVSRVRHENAISKLPYTKDHIQACIDSGVKKIVVFAHHRDCVEWLHDELPNSVYHYGGMSEEVKQKAVDSFQMDPNVVVFIGSIKATGMGITLTAASHVVFHEEDWTPAYISQAEDRCHRIGQADCVLAQHLVFSQTIDCQMAYTMVDKQRIIDAALDNERSSLLSEPISPLPPKGSTTPRVTITKKEIEERTLTTDQLNAVHLGLKMLAGVCDGANKRDDTGFNKVDSIVGHKLATLIRLSDRQAVLGQKLVRKYRRQLPEDIVKVATT